MNTLNLEVTRFLDNLNHPLRKEIDLLRNILIQSHSDLTENIKWNGPNYCFRGQDRITMRIHPPKQIQLVFHRGAKKVSQPKNRLIDVPSGLLDWKENDRAIWTYRNADELEKASSDLVAIVNKWIHATT